MDKKNKYSDSKQILRRLDKQLISERGEKSVTFGAMGADAGFVAKIVSHVIFNIYNIVQVTITQQGIEPVETGEGMQAFNIAESFTSPGQLPGGGYVTVLRGGKNNIFYKEV